MAWSILKKAINDAIKTNDNQEITGSVLQNTLGNIVSSIGENATFLGVLSKTTTNHVPDGPSFYIVKEKGLYTNFGNLVLNDGEFGILSNNGGTSSWTYTRIQEAFVDVYGDNKDRAASQRLVTMLRDSVGALEGVVTKLDKISYTSVPNEIGTTDYTFPSSYKAVPSKRRGGGVIFTDYNNEYAKYTVRFGDYGSSYTPGYFNLVVDSTTHRIDITPGEKGTTIAQRVLAMSFPNWEVVASSNTLTFTKKVKGVGTISANHTALKQFAKLKLSINLSEQHSAGNFILTLGKYNGSTTAYTIEVTEDDTQESLMKKVKAKFKDNSIEQLSENEIIIFFISRNPQAFSNVTSIDTSSVTGLTVNTIDDFEPYLVLNYGVTITEAVKTDGTNKLTTYIQAQAGNADSLANTKSNFRTFLYKEDFENEMSSNVYNIISDTDTYAKVPSARRKIGALISKNGSLFSFAGPISGWGKDMNLVPVSKIKFLVFKSGIAVMEPKKDSFGNYIHGSNWVFNVKKTLISNEIKTNGATLNSLSTISIPAGNYEVYTGNGAGVLWWNTITNSVECGYPSNIASCYAICTVAENYYNIVNIKSFYGVAAISKYSYGYFNAVPIAKGAVEVLNVLDILPDDFSTVDALASISAYTVNIGTLYFPAGEYKTSGVINRSRTIIGDGIDKTVIRNWDFTKQTDKVDTYMNDFSDITYRGLTLLNRGFGHYGMTNVDASGQNTVFEDVKIKFTLPASGGYIIYALAKNFKLTLKNFEIEVNDDGYAYAGIYLAGEVLLNIENAKVGTKVTKPFVGEGIATGYVKNVHVIGGQTGIFFGAQKNRPLDGLVVENCTVEGSTEECLSFDAYGNNVGKNPVIAELSINSASIEKEGDASSYYHNRLKIYCDARSIKGSHPKEYYEQYTFEGKEDYIKQFYVVFSQLAGDTFAGTVAKIFEVGTDEKGQYLVLNTQLAPEKLAIQSDTSITGSNNSNYQVASIMSGFFNCKVKNNTIRRGRSTGIALYQSFFNSVVDGNIVENCQNGSYLYAGRVLALPTWNGANGNIIINNRFEGGGSKGFMFVKYGGIKGYNNTFANNQIINSKGLSITGEERLVFEGNNIAGDESELSVTSTNTSSFGTKYPVAPAPGQKFFDTSLGEEKMWNGTEWI